MSTELITTEQYIADALKQYVPVVVGDKTISPDEHIATIANHCKGLTIAGLNDKKGYDTVKAALSKVKKLRTSIEGKRKELKDVALKYGKAVDGEAKRLTALVEPIEDELAAKIFDIDEAAEQARRAERTRRHTAMLEAGFGCYGGIYTAGPFNYSTEQVMEAGEDTLADILQRGRDEKERAEAERKRIQAEREENERKAKELAEREAELKKREEEAKAKEEHERGIVVGGTFTKPEIKPDPFKDVADPFENASVTKTVVNHAQAGYSEPGSERIKLAYSQGFEKLRSLIMERLNDPTPITRGELKTFVSSIQCPV